MLFRDCEVHLQEQLQIADTLSKHFNPLADALDIAKIDVEELRNSLQSEADHSRQKGSDRPQVGAIRMLGKVIGPVSPNLKLPMIATRDIGAAVADALLRLAFQGKQTQELQGSAISTTPKPPPLSARP